MDNVTPVLNHAYDKVKNDFRYFVKMCFFTLNPQVELQWNWHMDYLCWLAMRSMPVELNPIKDEAQRLKRLIINVPPRSLKSEIFSVALPCFIQGHDPSAQMLFGSFTGRLCKDFHRKSRQILDSEWYKEIFPAVSLTICTSEDWVTKHNGKRQSTSVGGTTTGMGGTLLVADDIMSADMAKSEAERKAANEWFDQSFMTRLNSPEKSAVIVIMQRLHELDTTGHILLKSEAGESDWFHACLPVVFDEEQKFEFFNQVKYVEPGELLFEKRWDLKTLAQLELMLTSVPYAGQYLQKPAPKEGALIPVDKIEYHVDADVPPSHLAGVRIIQSWDTASKTTVKNDYSVGQTWLYTPSMSYLIHMVREKLEFPELKKKIIAYADEWSPHTILIEDKSSGQALLQDIRRDTHLPLKAIIPKEKKAERAEAVSDIIANGNVSVPRNAPWRDEFIRECMFFPNGRNDDMVDAMTQYLNYIRAKSNMAKVRIRRL